MSFFSDLGFEAGVAASGSASGCLGGSVGAALGREGSGDGNVGTVGTPPLPSASWARTGAANSKHSATAASTVIVFARMACNLIVRFILALAPFAVMS